MTMVTLPTPLLIQHPVFSGGWTDTGITAAGYYVAAVFPAPKTGTIDKIHFLAGSKTSDGDGLLCSIEGVDATTGYPNGTPYGGGSSKAIASPNTPASVTASAWNTSPAGLASAVTKGDLVAAVLRSPPGVTYNGNIQLGISGNNIVSGTYYAAAHRPYWATSVASASKSNAKPLAMAIQYDDGTCPYIPGLLATTGGSGIAVSFNNGSNPDERGIKYQRPYKHRLLAMGFAINTNSIGDLTAKLYSASTGNADFTLSIDKDQGPGSSTSTYQWFYFPSPPTLNANADYWVTLVPADATSVTLARNNVPTGTLAALLNAYAGTSNWTGVSRLRTSDTDAGTWTESTATIPVVGLMIDQIDDGTGSGTGGFPGTSLLNGLVQQ